MEYPPCKNPNCKSFGQPHPNCQCYGGFAHGGSIQSYCESSQSHQHDCEYYADGGAVPSWDDTQEFTNDTNSQPEVVNSASNQTAPSWDNTYDLQEKYGNPLEQGKAALEGFAQGVAGPLAPLAEKHLLGVSDEDIRGRQEANPITHYGTEVLGLVAPAALTAGTSVAARAGLAGVAEALPAIAKVSQAGLIEQVVKAVLPKASETLAGKIGQGAAKAAIENMLVTGSDETSKLILNDPNTSADLAMVGRIGLSGVLGGALGAGISSAGPALKAAHESKLGGIIDDFVSRLKDHAGITTEEAAAPGMLSQNIPLSKDAPLDIATPSKESNPNSIGAKLANIFVQQGLGGKSAGAAVGATIAHAAGVNAALGALIGDHALGPFFNSILPGIAKAVVTGANSPQGFKAAVQYANAVVKGETLLNKATKNVFQVGADVVAEHLIPTDKDRNKLNKLLEETQINPQKLMEAKDNTSHYLPEHSDAMMQMAGTAMNYLNGLRANMDKKSPLDSVPVPSSSEKAGFNNALNIAIQPLVVIDKIKKGTLTNTDITALGNMYPNLYNRMKQKLTSDMINHVNKKESIPYQTRIGLSMFMATPLDSTMTPQSIVSAQMPSKAKPGVDTEQQAPKGTPSSPALQKMSQMYKTPGQVGQERRAKS